MEDKKQKLGMMEYIDFLEQFELKGDPREVLEFKDALENIKKFIEEKEAEDFDKVIFNEDQDYAWAFCENFERPEDFVDAVVHRHQVLVSGTNEEADKYNYINNGFVLKAIEADPIDFGDIQKLGTYYECRIEVAE